MDHDDDEHDEDTDEYFDESEVEDESGEFHESDEHDLDEDEEHESAEHHTEGDAVPAKKAAAEGIQSHQPSKISPENIQLNVIVEVGRLQMSVQKLMELQPGNLLELDVHPENGVDLVVNGK